MFVAQSIVGGRIRSYVQPTKTLRDKPIFITTNELQDPIPFVKILIHTRTQTHIYVEQIKTFSKQNQKTSGQYFNSLVFIMFQCRFVFTNPNDVIYLHAFHPFCFQYDALFELKKVIINKSIRLLFLIFVFMWKSCARKIMTKCSFTSTNNFFFIFHVQILQQYSEYI